MGGNLDDTSAQGRAPGNAVGVAGEDSGGAQQVVGDRLWAITARWTSTKSQGEASVEPRCAPDGFHKVTYLFYQVN